MLGYYICVYVLFVLFYNGVGIWYICEYIFYVIVGWYGYVDVSFMLLCEMYGNICDYVIMW